MNDIKERMEARVKAEPGNPDAWRELAQVKMMLGDFDGAENDLIECLKIAPDNAAGLVLMGNLLFNCKHDDAAAERYFAKAIAADESNATAHCNYGTLLLKRGDKFKAIGELRRSIAIDRGQCIPYYMLAQCYVSMKDWHSAWLVAKDALERGAVGFQDAENFVRVQSGLQNILSLAESNGGAAFPNEGEKAMEQSLRQMEFDNVQSKRDPNITKMMAMYMLGAIQHFDSLTPDEVKAIAREIALVGMHGIDTTRRTGYTLKTMPGEDFSGYRLLAYYYASWARAYPEHLAEIGLNFDDAYQLALNMQGKNLGGESK